MLFVRVYIIKILWYSSLLFLLLPIDSFPHLFQYQLIQWEIKISLWSYLFIYVFYGSILKLLIPKLLCLCLSKYLEKYVTLHSLTQPNYMIKVVGICVSSL